MHRTRDGALMRVLLTVLALLVAARAHADVCNIDWTRMTSSRLKVVENNVLKDAGASCSAVQVSYQRSFLSVNGVPLIGAMREGSYRAWDGTMESAHIDTPFDTVLLREGANAFDFALDDGAFNACRAESGGFTLSGGHLGKRDLFFFARNWGAGAYSASPVQLSASITLSLNEIDPQLMRDLSALELALARDGETLVATAASYADLAAALDQLARLKTDLQSLLDRGFDALESEELDALLARFTLVPNETREALVQLVADLKGNVATLRAEISRIANAHADQVGELVRVLEASDLSPLFDASDASFYSVDAALEDVPPVALPEVSALRPFDPSADPYDAYASETLRTLSALVQEGDVRDRVRFLGIVRAWRTNQSALQRAFEQRTGVSQSEWGAFLSAQRRVTDLLRQHLDAADWYKNTPVPPSVKAMVDRALAERFGAAARALKDGMNQWRGTSPSPQQALVLSTIEAIGASASTGEEDALRAMLNGAIVAVGEAAKIGASLTPIGDFIDLCETITGRELCSPTGEELSTIGRVASGAGLVFGSGAVWRAIGESIGSAAGVIKRVEHIADRLGDISRAERKRIVQAIGKDALAALEGLSGKEIKALVDGVGASSARNYALRTGYKAFSADTYRQNFITLTGAKVAGSEVHHVIPQFLEEEMRVVFGLNIHDPRLLAWWDKAQHLASSAEYNRRWVDALAQAHTTRADDILAIARDISASYAYKVLF